MSLGSTQATQRAGRAPKDSVLRLRDERLESYKAVVGKLAHDFNNFLAPQYGYLALLKDDLLPDSAAARYASAMEGAAQKSESYISTILLGMRPQRQFSPREFPFHEVLAELIEKWRIEFPNRPDIQVESSLEPFLCWGDEKQWRAVIDHLLSNARFALAMGGQLRVSLRRVALSGEEVDRLGLGTDDFFCLTVQDNGFGMTEEVARHAFDPFYTTRTQIKAPGLGLTIVHSVTLFHGGQVELKSVEDSGTTLTLWIPATPMDSQSRERTGSMYQGAKRRKRVLLIEDDPLIKEVLRTWLTGLNLEIENAASDLDAMKSLQRPTSDWSLIISEADLQTGPGELIYAKFKETRPEIPWLFLSGKRVPEIPLGSGQNDPLVMKKPFSHNAFVDVVQSYLNL